MNFTRTRSASISRSRGRAITERSSTSGSKVFTRACSSGGILDMELLGTGKPGSELSYHWIDFRQSVTYLIETTLTGADSGVFAFGEAGGVGLQIGARHGE